MYDFKMFMACRLRILVVGWGFGQFLTTKMIETSLFLYKFYPGYPNSYIHSTAVSDTLPSVLWRYPFLLFHRISWTSLTNGHSLTSLRWHEQVAFLQVLPCSPCSLCTGHLLNWPPSTISAIVPPRASCTAFMWLFVVSTGCVNWRFL